VLVIAHATGGTLSWERLDNKRAFRIKHIIESGGYRESLDGLASDPVGDGQNPKRR